MFERIGWLRRADQHSTRQIVPLHLHELSSLARRGPGYFYPDVLEALRTWPHLAWRVEDTSEYVIGGRWRRRAEIGSIEELRARSEAPRLIRHLATQLREEGATALILGNLEQERNLSTYLRQGFFAIDEIVRYQRNGTKAPLPDPEIEIRPLRHEDRDQLLEVDHGAFPWLWWNSEEEFDWYLSLPGVEAYVALHEGSVAGYAGITLSARQGHLDRLAVHPKHQGRGYGRALVCFILNRMAQRHIDRVALTTQVDNYRSASLYRSLGFVRTSVRYPIYGIWLEEAPAGNQPR